MNILTVVLENSKNQLENILQKIWFYLVLRICLQYFAWDCSSQSSYQELFLRKDVLKR